MKIVLPLVLLFVSSSHQIVLLYRVHLQEYLGVSLEVYGILLNLGLIPSAISTIVAGQCIERRGVVWTMRVYLGLLIVGYGLLSIPVASVFMLAAGLVICSMSAPGIFIAIQVYMSEVSRENIRRFTSLTLVITGLPGILYPLLVEALIFLQARSDTLTLSEVIHHPFIFFTLVLIVIFIILPKLDGKVSHRISSSHEDDAAFMPRKASGSTSSLLFISLLIVMIGACDSASHMWMTRILEEEAPTATLAPGVVISLYSGAYCISRGSLSVFRLEWLARSLIFAPALLGGVIFLIGVLHGGPALAYVYPLAALFYAFQFPLLLSRFFEIAGARKGRYLTLQLVVVNFVTLLMSMSMVFLRGDGSDGMRWMLLPPIIGLFLVALGSSLWEKWSGAIEDREVETRLRLT